MDRRGVLLIALALTGCGGSANAGYPPLPGPSPDTEVVAVSRDIATPQRPVFYYRDPKNRNRLLAYDWSGVLRGTVTVAATQPFGVEPSADGTMLLLFDAHIQSGGHAVGRVARGTWAGDNAHLCAFLNTIGGPGLPRTRQVSANESTGIDTPGALFYEPLTGKSRKVIDYGQFGPHGGPAVLACSAPNDRAVIGGSFVASMSGLTMVRLSDGKIVSRNLGGPHGGADGTLVSADGTLMAQGSTGGQSSGGYDAFTVFRIPSNQVVAEITGSIIQAFSADGTRALTVEYVGNSNEHGQYSVVNLATGLTLWSSILSPGTFLTRPGTGDFLVASRTYVANPSRPSDAATPFEDVWLVSADGSARKLLTHAVPLQ
jgi:hypothetical protein